MLMRVPASLKMYSGFVLMYIGFLSGKNEGYSALIDGLRNMAWCKFLFLTILYLWKIIALLAFFP